MPRKIKPNNVKLWVENLELLIEIRQVHARRMHKNDWRATARACSDV
jgi:hypothetical protein